MNTLLANPQTDPRQSLELSPVAQLRLAQVLRGHFACVWRSLRRFGVPESSADDAAQQVFSVFAARMAQVSPDKEQPFLIGVSARVAANFARKQRRVREIATDDVGSWRSPNADPEHLLIQKQRLAQLDTALDQLPAEQRAVFVLYEIEGFSLPEITRSLGIKLGTATSRLARARLRFEAWVEQNHTEGEP